MYNLVLFLSSDERARALEEMVAASPWADGIGVERVRDAREFEARQDAGLSIDILIVDTVLDPSDEGPTGIDFVRSHVLASGDTQVIYATEHAEYATKAYRTHHVYYLLEPVAQDELDDALSCAVRNLRAVVNRPISVRCGGKIQVVFPHRVAFVESDRRRCHIHMGGESLTTYATLDALVRALPQELPGEHALHRVGGQRLRQAVHRRDAAGEPEAPQGHGGRVRRVRQEPPAVGEVPHPRLGGFGERVYRRAQRLRSLWRRTSA